MDSISLLLKKTKKQTIIKYHFELARCAIYFGCFHECLITWDRVGTKCTKELSKGFSLGMIGRSSKFFFAFYDTSVNPVHNAQVCYFNNVWLMFLVFFLKISFQTTV